jgi:Leucine-rich repeat (LRR) protein
MGSISSSPSTSHDVVNTRKSIEDRLQNAAKTGVLNVARLDIKPNSPIWAMLADPEYAAKIKLLDISFNAMKSFPAPITLLINTKSLIASNCSIQKVIDLSSLVSLKQLDVSKNDLEDSTIGPLPLSLTKVNISANHLVRFSESLITLINLQELDISSNRLESVFGIGNLVSLIVLILDENQLVELPSDMANLTKLKKLSVKRNLLLPKSTTTNLQSIPAEIFTQTALDTLDLEGNAYIKKADILSFDGVDIFLERRRKVKERSIQGGALTDLSLFGIE